jgi:predicted metal-dependent HD superfamily phosphohydrolase
MGHHTIIEATEKFVRTLLKEKLNSDLYYHNLPHTLSVKKACEQLAARAGLLESEKEILILAALLHDTGFTNVYENHEKQSQQIAMVFLERQGYAREKIGKVNACIQATYPPHVPQDVLEELIRDADMYHLASEDYMQFNESLRHEWEVFQGRVYSDSEWIELNYNFFKDHTYHTEAARELFGPQKKANLKALKKMVKKDKSKKESPADIAGSRSAQMMFKTALRNHLDLSNLADNKANIMLSVNALIITIMVTGGATVIKNNNFIWPALGVLLATCMVSMIFATLATRPIKMTGYTDEEKIRAGESNLFFFGNFYKMNYKEYQAGMQQVITDNARLESSIMRDLYFLGRSLGNKYRRLRVCYTVFMIGVITTVIVFLISLLIYQPVL